MKEFKTALAFFVKRSGLSRAEICRRIKHGGGKITEPAISQALSGGIALAPDTVMLLAPVLGLDDNEIELLLLLSLGTKAKGEESASFVRDMIDRAAMDKNTIRVAIKEKAEVPIYGSIKAGSADLSADTAKVVGVTKMDQDEVRAGCFCMLISGESMEGEKIFDGELAFFQPVTQHIVSESDIYAVEVEGWPCWMVKKIRKLPDGKIGLLSAHPEHPAIEIDPENTKIAIKGRLLRTVRERGKSFKL